MGLSKFLNIFGERLRLHPGGAKVAATKAMEVVESNTEGAATLAAAVVAYFQKNTTAATDLMLALVSGTTGKAGIHFGDKDAQAGKIYFDNNTNSLFIETGAGVVIEITSSGDVKIGGGYGATGFTATMAGALSLDAELTCATLNATTTKVVVGPSSPTDGRLALFDGTTGRLLKQAVIGCDTSGNLSNVGTVSCGALTGTAITCTGLTVGSSVHTARTLDISTAVNTNRTLRFLGNNTSDAQIRCDTSNDLVFFTAGSTRMTIAAGGTITIATALIHTGIRAVTATGSASNPEPAHGTYTPTLTGVANTDSVTARVCKVIRQGNNIIIDGQFDVDVTNNTTLTKVGISNPVSSNFAAATDVRGSGSCTNVTLTLGVDVYADATNDRIEVAFTSGSTGSHTINFRAHITVI